MPEKRLEKIAKAYFESDQVVEHYFRESQRIGLWKSEDRIIQDSFLKNESLMDLGCGTGRIAFAMEELGYKRLYAVDYSVGMIEAAQLVARSLGSKVKLLAADARALPFENGCFDGIIFGFNGLFMIPNLADRKQALDEIFRVLKPGGRFICTGHDRNLGNQRVHWTLERSRWKENQADHAEKYEFGDVVAETELGSMYIHSTTETEALDLLNSAGFVNVQSWLRRELGNEGPEVRQFSDECRFWKAIKTSSSQIKGPT